MAGARCHAGTLDAGAPGPASVQAVAAGTGPGSVAAGRGWLDAAGTSGSLIVPSFAVHDYGELVRAEIILSVSDVTQLNRELRTEVSDTSKSASSLIIYYHKQTISLYDFF